ncbi:cytochrome P450 78A3 [Cordyceps fumosorosea ARSEF 2679]|uniref:Cytochrome P450 78A3 n=1 Tax=Cordyceps fumosorosea (strain ARSEF 2679) TaxID=1081104 RepID=A0A168E4W8_CORFA|nr:cytochrome P450 78A3 [Cordyceps fumosorosea ARSEF 2679]OAA73378.1 cytochrome P450 78A3 [Cordyceps fumosorosea ARSEF 2679]
MPAAIPTITVGSGLGATAFMLTNEAATRTLGVKVFAALWAAQFLAYGFYCMFIYPFFLSPLRHLPTASGWQLGLGHSVQAINKGLGPTGRKWIAETPNDGFIRMFGPFHREYVFVTSPAALAEITVSKAYEFEKPRALREVFGSVLGHGLVLVEGQEHKLQRRNLLPAFAFRHIKDLYPLFWSKACEVVQVMSQECDADGRAEIEVEHWAGRVSLDVIGVAGMGRDFDATHNEHDPLVKTYMSIATHTAQDRLIFAMVDLLSSVLPPSFILNPLVPRPREMMRASKQIRGVCSDLIRAKKERLRESKLDDVDILSVAMRSGVFDEEELVHHMMTFLGAGHETTASALTLAIYALCCHPDIQTRLREEIRANLPPVTDPREMTSLEIDRLPYLGAVCSEALRLYSPVPQSGRVAVRDTVIQGQRMPKGTRLLLLPWAVNADAGLWGADSSQFRPERWLVADAADGLGGTAANAKDAALGGASSNYAFMSFLHGPRSCIGMSFAKGEFACLLAAWVGRFEFELRDKAMLDEANIKFEQLVTSKIAGGLHVRMRVIPGY